MKKVFLDELPRKEGKGVWKGKQVIDWKSSIGCKVKFIYEDIECEVEIVDYKGDFLYIKYLDKDIFKINTNNFKKCSFGKKLFVNKGITVNFKIEIGQVFKDDKRDIIITDNSIKYRYRIRNGKTTTEKERYYKYKCNKCGYDKGWIKQCHLLSGKGCSCCASKTVVPGINDIPTTAPWMVKFFQGGYEEAKMYTKYSSQKIKPVCPDCGRVRNKSIKIDKIYDQKSISCSCGDGKSYPEKFMYNIFEQLGVNFISEYSPEWIGRKRYDFYFELENNKYIVEMDGAFHKKDNNMNGQTVEESRIIDTYKDKMASKYGIKVIRINSDKSELEYIKDNILNSKLVYLFDLSLIDWNKVESFALSNRVKEACEYNKSNPDMTTKEIGEIMKLSNVTIIKYLKRGNKIGWCEYDPKEENFKGSSKAEKSKSKDFKYI